MLSNLHSFHFGTLLQNSSALPWHVYQNTTNKLLLSPLKSTTATVKSTTGLTQATTPIKHQPLKRRNTYLAKQPTTKLQAAKPEKTHQGNFHSSRQPTSKWKSVVRYYEASLRNLYLGCWLREGTGGARKETYSLTRARAPVFRCSCADSRAPCVETAT